MVTIEGGLKFFLGRSNLDLWKALQNTFKVNLILSLPKIGLGQNWPRTPPPSPSEIDKYIRIS